MYGYPPISTTRRGNAHASRSTADRQLPSKSSYFRLPNLTSLPPTRMVGAGNVHSMLWTFLRLRNTCKLASMNIHSDNYGDLTVTVRMTIAGQADQAPRRGGGSPAVRRGALALRPPPLWHLQPLLPLPLPLHLPPHLPLPEGPGGVVLESFSETRGGGWLE